MPPQMKWAVSFAIGLALIAAGWYWMPGMLTALHVLVSFVLILVVLLQSGKAADLAGAFGGAGSQTAFGPRGAATFLSKTTTWCAVMFMLTSLSLTMRGPEVSATGGGSRIFEERSAPAESAPAPQQTPPPAEQPPAEQTPPPSQP